MEHDASDILGQNTMPNASRARDAIFSLSLGQYIGIFTILFGLYVFGLRLWRRVLLWRERSFRLATRRRHGIPDNDMRPFNVAYADAAMRAREETDRQIKPGPAPLPYPSIVDLREASQDQIIRNRSGIPQRPDAGMRSTVIPVPGGYGTAPAGSYLPSYAENSNATNHTHPYSNMQADFNAQFAHAPSPSSKPLTRQHGYLNIQDAVSSSQEDKKRPFDDEMDEDHETKKSRVDEDAVMGSDVDVDEGLQHKRGSKRGLLEDDADDIPSSKKSREKRARNGLQERTAATDISMDVDDEEADEVADLRSVVRGKKRDRAEAGSTFGGDDDSADDAEANGDSKARRRRKRRTVGKRKSEVSYQRGKKRDREGSEDDELSDGSHSNSPGRKSARTKRGKRASNGVQHDHSTKDDVSMDGSTTSIKSKVRSVGDEWESGGIRYKIGPNYQRLRQALVKKARQKFLMPKDSQHPDRQEHLQVYIETWLTEEEYKEAKEQHLLAWQDDSPVRPEHKDNLTIDVTQANVNIPGKSLLWGSSTTTTPTMSPAPPSPTSDAGTLDSVKPHRNPPRHSIATTTGLPAVTYIPTTKRIASTSQVLNLAASTTAAPVNASGTASPAPGLSDSTNAVGSPRAPTKVFSKWEKQELEARAMMKIREANRRKEIERESKAREEREAAERAEKERERQRQEKERVEREQREARERAQKEAQQKAEAEKKAKDAAEATQKSSYLPQITVTAPSMGNLGAQPSQSGTPASGTASGPAPGAFNFGLPANPSSGAAAPSPFGAPKTAAPATSNPFAPSTNSTQSATLDATKTETKPAAPSGFSFATSSTTTSSATPAASTNSGFKTGPQAPASTNPLFARLGPPAATGEPAKPASAPMFSFNTNKPDATPKPSPFGAPAPSAQLAATSADPTATTTPKFNFGFAPKTAAPAANTNNAASAPKSVFGAPAASSLSGALGSNTLNGTSGSAAAPSPFGGFKTPAAPASATNGANTTTPASTASGFGFGGGPSSFGTTSAFPSTTPASTPAKSAFGNTNAFGSSAGSGSSPFGATAAQTQSPFGGGAAANKQAEEKKPLFSFATPTAPSASSTPSAFTAAAANNSSNGGAVKSAFSFGGTTTPANPPSSMTPSTPADGAAAAAAAAPPKFSFSFGSGAAPSSTPAVSPFGTLASSGQSVFSGGVFGATNQAQQQ